MDRPQIRSNGLHLYLMLRRASLCCGVVLGAVRLVSPEVWRFGHDARLLRLGSLVRLVTDSDPTTRALLTTLISRRAFGFLVSSIVYYRPALRKRFIIFLATAYGEADLAREDSVAWCERAHQGEYGLKPAGLLIAKWAVVALFGPALAALVGSAGLGLDERQGSLSCKSPSWHFPARTNVWTSC